MAIVILVPKHIIQLADAVRLHNARCQLRAAFRAARLASRLRKSRWHLRAAERVVELAQVINRLENRT